MQAFKNIKKNITVAFLLVSVLSLLVALQLKETSSVVSAKYSGIFSAFSEAPNFTYCKLPNSYQHKEGSHLHPEMRFENTAHYLSLGYMYLIDYSCVAQTIDLRFLKRWNLWMMVTTVIAASYIIRLLFGSWRLALLLANFLLAFGLYRQTYTSLDPVITIQTLSLLSFLCFFYYLLSNSMMTLFFYLLSVVVLLLFEQSFLAFLILPFLLWIYFSLRLNVQRDRPTSTLHPVVQDYRVFSINWFIHELEGLRLFHLKADGHALRTNTKTLFITSGGIFLIVAAFLLQVDFRGNISDVIFANTAHGLIEGLSIKWVEKFFALQSPFEKSLLLGLHIGYVWLRIIKQSWERLRLFVSILIILLWVQCGLAVVFDSLGLSIAAGSLATTVLFREAWRYFFPLLLIANLGYAYTLVYFIYIKVFKNSSLRKDS